jgi:hypothetical protein
MENRNIQGDDGGGVVALAPVSVKKAQTAPQKLVSVQIMQWAIEQPDVEMYIQQELRFFSSFPVYDQKYDPRVANLLRVTRMNFYKTLDDNAEAARARWQVLREHVWHVTAWVDERNKSGMSTENLDIRMSPEQTEQFQASLLDYDIMMGNFFRLKTDMDALIQIQSEVRQMGPEALINNKHKPLFLKMGFANLWLSFHHCEHEKKQYEQKILNIFDTNAIEQEITGDVFGMTI